MSLSNPVAQPSSVPPLLQVYVVPDAQYPNVIANVINQARQYVWLEMYMLTDPQIISALAAASQRHAAQPLAGQADIDVRVILEPQPYGLPPSPALTNPLATFGTPNVQVRPSPPSAFLPLKWSPQQHFYNHAKLALIDDVAYVMSSNLSKSGTGNIVNWGTFHGDRDYIVMDQDPHDVQTLKTIFTADWSGQNWNSQPTWSSAPTTRTTSCLASSRVPNTPCKSNAKRSAIQARRPAPQTSNRPCSISRRMSRCS